MRTTVILSACLLLAPLSLPGAEEPRFRPEACFPDGILYGSIASVGRLEERFAGTLLGRMATHPGVRKSFEGCAGFLREKMAAGGAQVVRATGKSPLEILGLIQGEAALGISFSPDGLPAIAIALELGKTKDEILDVRGKLKALAEEETGSPLETVAIDGFEASAWPGPAGPILEGILGTHLVIASTRDLFTSIAAAHKAKAGAGAEPREKAFYPDLARDLAVSDREALLIVDLEALRGVLLENVPEEQRENLEKVLRVAGLDRLTSLGGALGFRDGGAESVWRLAMKDGPGGILGVLAKSLPAVGDLDEALGRIPAAAAEVQAGRIDIGGLLRGIDGVVREVFPEMGDQLDQAYGEAERFAGISVKEDLFSLGDVTAHSFSVAPPAGGLFSDEIVLVKTDSLEPCGKLLEKVGARLGSKPRAIGPGGAVTYLNLTDGQLVEWLRQAILGSGGLWTPSFPELLILMTASAGFARADAGDGWTVASALPQSVIRHVDIHSKGPRLAGAPEGAELAALLRREAKGASAVLVSRGGSGILALYNSLLPLANGFYPMLKAVGIDPAELPPGEAFAGDVKPGYLRLSVDPKGFTLRGHRVLETRAGILIAVGGTAFAAGFLVPVLGRMHSFESDARSARPGARRPEVTGASAMLQCGNRLKMFYGYALAYSDKSGTRAFPFSDKGSPASLQLLIDFEPESPLEPPLFVCPSHGASEPAREGGKVVLTADTTSYETVPWRLKNTELNAFWMYDKEPVHDGGRNVLFTDGSVQWLAEDAFQKALAEQRQRLSKAKATPKKAAPKKKPAAKKAAE